MSSMFTNLLFLHGHIADPALARRLAEAPKEPPRSKGKRERVQTPAPTLGKVPGPPALAAGGCG